MDLTYLLLITLLLPLVGTACMPLVAPAGRTAIRGLALLVTALTLGATVILMAAFPSDGEVGSGFFELTVPWLNSMSGINIQLQYRAGRAERLAVRPVRHADGDVGAGQLGGDQGPASVCSTPCCCCWSSGCWACSVARDIILFYVFFEFTLIPLFFLIGIWGSEERRYAAIKFFLFTLAGSVLTFLGLLAIVLWDLPDRTAAADVLDSRTDPSRWPTHPIQPLSLAGG